MRRIICFISCVTTVLLLSGCMGYQLGGGRPAGIETVAVAPVINRSGEPAVELQLTRALRQRIQFDGRWKLVDSSAVADGVIEVTLTEYDLTPIAFRDSMRSTPQLYRLRLEGSAVLKETESGNEIASANGYGEATLPYQYDLTSAKRDALPDAADDFVTYLLDDLLEQW